MIIITNGTSFIFNYLKVQLMKKNQDISIINCLKQDDLFCDFNKMSIHFAKLIKTLSRCDIYIKLSILHKL